MSKIVSKERMEEIKKKGNEKLYPAKGRVAISWGSCCIAKGAEEVYEVFKEELKEGIVIKKVGCWGYWEEDPIVSVSIDGFPKLLYKKVDKDKAKKIVQKIKEKQILKEEVLCKITKEKLDDEVVNKEFEDNSNTEEVVEFDKVGFFGKQKRIVLRNCGIIDPEDIEEYVGRGGYFGLYKAIKELNPEEIIEEVKKSGLRGRGGVGFPTGKKWEYCKKAEGDKKYIICNAHEGDPGAYGNKLLLESDPHTVIEGIIIGGYAVGAIKGYIYIDHEYKLAISRLKRAINEAKEYGFLGENILGSDFNFDLQIVEGQGAYICGEETSLIESSQGITPEPRRRPPFPAEIGIWGKPTVVNNVETWGNVPLIIVKGGEWLAKKGTEGSKGTKVVSLSGSVSNKGIAEVEMGTTMREIVFEIGGGVSSGKEFKGIQIGGPLGGFMNEEDIDTKLDYEETQKIVAPMGSGGIIVLNKEDCVVDLVRFLFNFVKEESCGKCTSCREGSRVIYELLDRVKNYDAQEKDLALLKEIGETIKEASVCGLGQGIPVPLISSMEKFKEDYDTHVNEKRCVNCGS